MGLFLILTVLVGLPWAGGFWDPPEDIGRTGYGEIVNLAIMLPGALVYGMTGALYRSTGVRARTSVAQSGGVRWTGTVSLILVVIVTAIMLSMDWHDSNSIAWHVLAVLNILVLGAHHLIVGALGRGPDSAPPFWLLPVAAIVIAAAIMVANTAPPRHQTTPEAPFSAR